MFSFQVGLQFSPDEFYFAEGTLDLFDDLEVSLTDVALAALVFVPPGVALNPEGHVAGLALEGLLASMGPHMEEQAEAGMEREITAVALEAATFVFFDEVTSRSHAVA